MTDTQQPEALEDLRQRLRGFEADHTPDGWPAVRMRDISALLDDLDSARSDNQVLRLGYAAARLEIESLNAQLHAVKQINAAQFGLLAASPTPPAEQPACDTQLFKFYGVNTSAELIAAQARHIEKLQAKLPPTPSFAPQRVRKG